MNTRNVLESEEPQVYTKVLYFAVARGVEAMGLMLLLLLSSLSLLLLSSLSLSSLLPLSLLSLSKLVVASIFHKNIQGQSIQDPQISGFQKVNDA